MPNFKFIFVAFFLGFVCESGYAKDIDIKGVDIESVGQVFYVRLFDGYLPIPGRYVLMPSKSNANELFLLSTRLTKKKAEIKIFNENNIAGTIYIGTRKNCSVCDASEPDKSLYSAVEEYTWKYGINVKVCHVSSGEIVVYIFNSDSYLAISDGDIELWKILLANFHYSPASKSL
jgi:hypothetical protein